MKAYDIEWETDGADADLLLADSAVGGADGGAGV